MLMVVVVQLNVSSNILLMYLGLLTSLLNLEMYTNSGRLMLPHMTNRYKEPKNKENQRSSNEDNKSLFKIILANYGIFVQGFWHDALTRALRQILTLSVPKPWADKW